MSFGALIAKFHKSETIVPTNSEEETEESNEDYPNANKNPTYNTQNKTARQPTNIPEPSERVSYKISEKLATSLSSIYGLEKERDITQNKTNKRLMSIIIDQIERTKRNIKRLGRYSR